jgi:hypothetical protein
VQREQLSIDAAQRDGVLVGMGCEQDSCLQSLALWTGDGADTQSRCGGDRPRTHACCTDELRECYEHALQATPGIHGVWFYELTVGTDGRVSAAKLVGAATRNLEIEACVTPFKARPQGIPIHNLDLAVVQLAFAAIELFAPRSLEISDFFARRVQRLPRAAA